MKSEDVRVEKSEVEGRLVLERAGISFLLQMSQHSRICSSSTRPRSYTRATSEALRKCTQTLKTQAHSFSHLLRGLFVPHLLAAVRLGCSGQGWHPSDLLMPTNTHTPTDMHTHNKNTEGLAL